MYKITWLVFYCEIKVDFALTGIYKWIDNSVHVYMFPWYQTGRNSNRYYITVGNFTGLAELDSGHSTRRTSWIDDCFYASFAYVFFFWYGQYIVISTLYTCGRCRTSSNCNVFEIKYMLKKSPWGWCVNIETCRSVIRNRKLLTCTVNMLENYNKKACLISYFWSLFQKIQ